ncbi:MAG: 16S rRNA (adenine1518-N6/adenine1519-N6)-dimethyltransferase [Candidatus Midichloriaceae bacterium]|jgi:16S rRNA (adenine1518-N6/adenine1519-N6)-dimethyltransferase
MSELKDLKLELRRNNIFLSKKLGQNFLVNQDIVDNIVKSLGDIDGNNILEIGPGAGKLTKRLLKTKLSSLVSVEIDKKMLTMLNESIEDPRFNLVNADALYLNEEEIFKGNFKIVANLPYNISTKLMIKWFKKIQHIDEIVIMLQKEVADRVVAENNSSDYSRLSIISQFICDCEILFDVESDNFFPEPRICSSVIKLKPKHPKKSLFEINRLEKACKIIFNFRRKKIGTILKKVMEDPEIKLKDIGISINKRPEQLTIDEIYKISCIIE